MSDLIAQIMDRIFQELELKPITKHLVAHLLWDLPLTIPECVDFGVVTPDHYRALVAVLQNGDEQEDAEEAYDELRRRIVELDKAYGDGPLLNALVQKYAPEYAQRVRFSTSWDLITGHTDSDPRQSG